MRKIDESKLKPKKKKTYRKVGSRWVDVEEARSKIRAKVIVPLRSG
jgi:hypothetical protein